MSQPPLHRRSVRLPHYDYAQSGMYFVTICTQNRECRFGHIEDGDMHLTPLGRIVFDQWFLLPDRFVGLGLDSFVVMPNHIHGILVMNHCGTTARVAPTLGQIIGAYKSLTHKICLRWAKENEIHLGNLWQRNYYEHVIRTDEALENIRQYIQSNPIEWASDQNNPVNLNL